MRGAPGPSSDSSMLIALTSFRRACLPAASSWGSRLGVKRLVLFCRCETRTALDATWKKLTEPYAPGRLKPASAQRGPPRPSRSRRCACSSPAPSARRRAPGRPAGEMQDGEAEVAVDDLGRLGLLHVEVEVAERAGGDEAVGAGVDRVADVGPGLFQRGLAVHRDHREAAAFAGPVVLDDLAAEGDDTSPGRRRGRGARGSRGAPSGGRCSSRRRGRPWGPLKAGRLTWASRRVEAAVLDQQPEEVLVGRSRPCPSRRRGPGPRAPR